MKMFSVSGLVLVIIGYVYVLFKMLVRRDHTSSFGASFTVVSNPGGGFEKMKT